VADITALVERLSAHPSAAVVTHERRGFAPRTYAQLRDDVRERGLRLRERGIEPFMRVGVLATNCYDWLVLDLALLELRCEVVAFTTAQVDADLEDVAVQHEICALLVAGAPSTVKRFTRLGWVVAADGADPIPLREGGLRRGDEAWGTPFRVFSSGTTGSPRCMLASCEGLGSVVDALRATYEFDATDTVLLFLPVANLQQRFLVYAALWHGISIVLVEPIHLMAAFKETHPTLLLAPPLLFETMARKIVNRRPVRALLGAAARLPDRGPAARLRSAVLRPIRRRVLAELGGKMRLMITGMAPISRATLDVFRALDLPLYEAYGMNECAIIASNTPGHARVGSVGRPVSGVKVELAPDGEVVVERPVPITVKYVDVDNEVNAETYIGANRVATGDLGRFDEDGFLYLIGRKKNVILLSDGRKIHPEVLEREITSIPLLAQAAVLPDGPGLACVIHATDSSARFERKVREDVNQLIKELSGQEVTRVVFSKEPFTMQNGLLTQNLKLNRTSLRSLVAAHGGA